LRARETSENIGLQLNRKVPSDWKPIPHLPDAYNVQEVGKTRIIASWDTEIKAGGKVEVVCSDVGQVWERECGRGRNRTKVQDDQIPTVRGIRSLESVKDDLGNLCTQLERARGSPQSHTLTQTYKHFHGTHQYICNDISLWHTLI
jgi:hypothetical protein